MAPSTRGDEDGAVFPGRSAVTTTALSGWLAQSPGIERPRGVGDVVYGWRRRRRLGFRRLGRSSSVDGPIAASAILARVDRGFGIDAGRETTAQDVADAGQRLISLRSASTIIRWASSSNTSSSSIASWSSVGRHGVVVDPASRAGRSRGATS
jgi:hypothetical protein